MRKHTKQHHRITLHRETLVCLEDAHLEQVAAASIRESCPLSDTGSPVPRLGSCG